MVPGPHPIKKKQAHIRVIKTVGKHSWDKYGGLACNANLFLEVVSISKYTRGIYSKKPDKRNVFSDNKNYLLQEKLNSDTCPV